MGRGAGGRPGYGEFPEGKLGETRDTGHGAHRVPPSGAGASIRDEEEAIGVFSRAVPGMLLVSMLQLTAFAPDEYFQGPEVAHRVVFGYGHLTWEWVVGLRSYLHPMVYAAMYKVVSGSLPDSFVGVVTWWGPYLLHAVIAAWTLAGAHRLAEFVFRPSATSGGSLRRLNAGFVGWNWFMGYCLTRPYSNSLEAALCTHGLVAYMRASFAPPRWIHDVTEKDRIRFIVVWVMLGALCVVLRPASGLFWAMLAVRALLWPAPGTSRARYRVTLLALGVAVSGIVLALTTWLDWFMYGRLEIVPWNFLRFNVLEGGSALYGTSPWHANVTMHAPSMLLIAFPAFWYGWYVNWMPHRHQDGRAGPAGRHRRDAERGGALEHAQATKQVSFLAWCAFFYCAVYSIPAHKEVRFLLPAVPMCMPAVSYGVDALARRLSVATFARVYKWLNVVALAYFSLVHQRGQVGVLSVVRRLHAAGSPEGGQVRSTSVLFLTPCHFTPYYAYIHTREIKMRFFDCSPAAYRSEVDLVNAAERSWLRLPDLPDGVSEREYFESDPDRVTDIALRIGRPDVVVSLKGHGSLQKHGYTLHWQHWNPMDPVQVYTKGAPAKGTRTTTTPS